MIDGPSDTSGSSRAEVNGLMVVDAVTFFQDKPKTLYITGAFYTVAGPVLGIFKYFNKHDYKFIVAGSRLFVNATVWLC